MFCLLFDRMFSGTLREGLSALVRVPYRRGRGGGLGRGKVLLCSVEKCKVSFKNNNKDCW